MLTADHLLALSSVPQAIRVCQSPLAESCLCPHRSAGPRQPTHSVVIELNWFYISTEMTGIVPFPPSFFPTFFFLGARLQEFSETAIFSSHKESKTSAELCVNRSLRRLRRKGPGEKKICVESTVKCRQALFPCHDSLRGWGRKACRISNAIKGSYS